MELDELLEEVNYKEAFEDRTRKHIARVIAYGKKIGKDYSDHDSDKLTTLFDDYALMNKRKNLGDVSNNGTSEGLTPDEEDRLNKATEAHVKNNAHHAEHWCEENVDGFDRFNPPMGLHCESMPNYAIDEMMADWCAMSEEFGNTPQQWLKKTVPSRWVFTEDQIKYMYDVLDKMWKE